MRSLISRSLFLLLINALSFGQPRIEIAHGGAIDFGTYYSGLKKVYHAVTVRNIGTDTLIISKVIANCGCTAALSSALVVPPGDSTNIKITFTIGSYRGDVGKQVRVLSNDTSRPTSYINFAVHILDVLAPTPDYMYFYDVKLNAPVKKSFELKNVTKVPITILKATSKESMLAIVTPPKKTLKPGEVTKMVVSLTPRQLNYMQGEIELVTNFKPSPVVTLGYNAVGKD